MLMFRIETETLETVSLISDMSTLPLKVEVPVLVKGP